MESAEAKMTLKINYVVYTKVTYVAERFDERYTNIAEAKTEGQVEKERRSKGWFVQFEGSHEAIHLGNEKPTFEVGDTIRITFEKVTLTKVERCPPSNNTPPQSS